MMGLESALGLAGWLDRLRGALSPAVSVLFEPKGPFLTYSGGNVPFGACSPVWKRYSVNS